MNTALPDAYIYEYSNDYFIVQLATHTARALFSKGVGSPERDYIHICIFDISLLYEICDSNCLVLKHLGKITKEPPSWDNHLINLQNFQKTK